MMQIALRLVTLALIPLVGLGMLWGWSDHLSRQGTDWEVEIAGYDPRDLLRGHYVEFTYEWPIIEDGPGEDGPGEDGMREEMPPWQRARRMSNIAQLCLTGKAPVITEAVVVETVDATACEHPVIADAGGVYGRRSLSRGRLYVGQDRAKAIEEEMRNRDQRGIVTFRQRDDGTLTPLDIRFRPLTEAELAERGDEPVDPGDIVLSVSTTEESAEPDAQAAEE